MESAEHHVTPDGIEQWWVEPADDRTDDLAAREGLVPVRRVLQLRRPLPLPDDHAAPITTRAFQPGRDDAEWLAVNAEAFAWHPEQGRWQADDLEARMAEPWFESEGFLLHHIEGDLAGFCWTRPHPETVRDPALGEIHVIAVRPRFAGRGLGRALTAAGLNWLWEHHRPPFGMLYVESTNDKGRSLYASMGFVLHSHRVAYERDER